MPVNLSDWLGANPWSLWVIVAALCLGAELITPSKRVVGWGAVGAGCAALVALILPDLWPLHLVTAGVVSGALVLLASDTSVTARSRVTPR